MFEEIISALLNSEKIGIFTHVNPDGDALGSSYSLKLAMLSLGKKAEVYALPNADCAAKELTVGQDSTGLAMEECDLLAALDCADFLRLGIYSDFFKKHPNTIAIDHHITHKPFAGLWIAFPVSSTCEVMFTLYKEMGITLTKDIAHNLYIGLSSDTGNFKYPSTSSATLRIAADLIETGIDFAGISKRLFTIKSKEYYALMQIALNKLNFFDEGKICVLALSQEDFDLASLDESEATGIVTLPAGIEGVEVGVYIRARSTNEYKISLRSVNSVDVSKIAVVFGGGGHARASGYSAYNTSVNEITEKVIAEIEKQL